MPHYASYNALGASVQQGELDPAIEFSIVPIGAMIPWLKSLTGVPSLPEGWVECDGSAISDSDSPMNGQNTPNMTGKFLRGAATSGGTGGADTHNHGGSTSLIGGDRYASEAASGSYTGLSHYSGSACGGAVQGISTNNNIPAYVEAVWIMRIK